MDHVEVPLWKGRGSAAEIVGLTIVDAASIEKHPMISTVKWRLGSGYVRVAIGKKLFYLSRVLCGLKHGDPREADHINGDKLDNRMCNLRIVSHHDNGQNIHRVKTSSPYRGVYYVPHCRHRPYMAQVCADGVRLPSLSFAYQRNAARWARALRLEWMSGCTTETELDDLSVPPRRRVIHDDTGHAEDLAA